MVSTVKRSGEGELFVRGEIITDWSSHSFFYISIQFDKFSLVRIAKIDRR